MSLESDLDECEEGFSKRVKKKKRYLEWNLVHDLTQKFCLKLGLFFNNNTDLKDTLTLYAIQHGFDYNYLHNEKKRVSAYCKRDCGWRICCANFNTRKCMNRLQFSVLQVQGRSHKELCCKN
jgi:hypothetical protein